MIKTGYMEASQHYRAAPVVTKVIYTYGVSFFRLSMDCNMMTCIVWTALAYYVFTSVNTHYNELQQFVMILRQSLPLERLRMISHSN